MTLNDIDFQITLPHVGFHRKIGEFKNSTFDITGNPLSADDWTRRRDTMLPNGDDQAFIEHLMAETPEREIGKYAGWIAPPRVGIDNKPGDFEYVKLA